MKLAPLILIFSLSAFASGHEFQKPHLNGRSYLANDAEEVFNLARIHQKRANDFCLSQNFQEATKYKVKYISTVKYDHEERKFKWLSPIEMIAFEKGRAMIKEYKTTYHVLSAYRNPAHFISITCN